MSAIRHASSGGGRAAASRTRAAARVRRVFARVRRAPARFRGAQDGLAAVEFAMVLPLLLLLYLGTTDLAGYVSNFRKVTLAARTVADLVAREDGTVSASEFSTIAKAGRAVLAPYDTSTARIVAKAIGVYDANGTARVCSYAQDAGAGAAAAPSGLTAVPTVPDAFKTAGIRYVVVELTMTYKPLFGTMLATKFNLSTLTETVVWPVRNGKVYNVAVTSAPEVVLPTVATASLTGACPSN
ncbi:TadE/TadG family type IV pilus assembly protein [Methylobacterium nonmethylotrophicum]|uniref:Pilus assembly protein n=1 Tax=Methylobacterium nonmethylotrophicum TaxID=1141884 RepID=A0A4Z0NP53_9HYPH|nr:TadE/TadG family type IV pilus assembly protein [Methylobacterium nonmethylotrophicum]TGD98601.1 pilus assembly protein [Methylobacterium nonmethylotrophicum]